MTVRYGIDVHGVTADTTVRAQHVGANQRGSFRTLEIDARVSLYFDGADDAGAVNLLAFLDKMAEIRAELVAEMAERMAGAQ